MIDTTLSRNLQLGERVRELAAGKGSHRRRSRPRVHVSWVVIQALRDELAVFYGQLRARDKR